MVRISPTMPPMDCAALARLSMERASAAVWPEARSVAARERDMLSASSPMEAASCSTPPTADWFSAAVRAVPVARVTVPSMSMQLREGNSRRRRGCCRPGRIG
jgi:hypothetical protein